MAKYTHSHASLDLKAHAMSIMKGSGCQVCFLRVKLHFRKAIWAWLELTSESTDRQLTRILCKSFLVSAHTTTHFIQKWILLLLQVALSWLIPLKSSYDPILNYSPAVKPKAVRQTPCPCVQTILTTTVSPGKHWRSLTGHPRHTVLQADHSRLRLGKLLGVVTVPIICWAAALYSSKCVGHRKQTLLLQTQGGFEGRWFRVDGMQQVLR